MMFRRILDAKLVGQATTMRYLSRLLIVFVLLWAIPAFADLPERDSADPMAIAYWECYDRLAALYAVTDLDGLLQEAERIEAEWPSRDVCHYAELMQVVCAKLNNRWDLLPNGKADIASLAARALEKRKSPGGDAFPVEAEYLLLCQVQPIRDYKNRALRPESKHAERRAQLVRYLEVLRRCESLRGTAPDPNQMLLKNVPPPAETHLPPGIAPEAIEDPALRAEYEAALRANSERARKAIDHRRLADTTERVMKGVSEFVSYAFCRTDADVAELEQLVSEYVTVEAHKRALLAAPRDCP